MKASIEMPEAKTETPQSDGFTLSWPMTIRGIITAPRATVASVAATRTWQQAVMFYLLVALSERILSLARPASERVTGSAWLTFWSSPAMTLALLPLAPLLIAVTTLIVYRFGKRQGGIGPFAPLYTAELVNSAALIAVGAPFLLTCYLLMRATNGWSLIDTPITIIQGCWAFYLSACSLRAVMSLSWRGAARAIAQGWAVFVGAALLLACVGAAFVIALT